MSEQNSRGFGCMGILAALFVGHKLNGDIDWSWWWVFAPIWGPVAAVLVARVAGLIVIYAAETAVKFYRRAN